jgi:hypothetical protein
MFKAQAICVFCTLLWMGARCGPDTLLQKLTVAIEMAHDYDAVKLKRIGDLTDHPPGTSAVPGDNTGLFGYYQGLYEEYRLFQYDSAYGYAGKMLSIAYSSGNQSLITQARLQLCFILLSSGLFRETFDSLKTVVISGEPDSLKAMYYTLLGRYYFDLANYDFDGIQHSIGYDIRGTLYMDSALAYYPKNSFEYRYYRGLRDFKKNDTAEAASLFEGLLSESLPAHQLALVASTLSGIFLQQGKRVQAIDLMIRAAISDIQSSTKETFATFNLAELLYQEGDVRHAGLCIESAIDNAEFYGARQRKVQVSSILSLIENQRLSAADAQRRLLVQYAIVVTLFLLLLGALTFVIRRQNRQLRKAQQLLTESHHTQRLINEQLERTNAQLEEANKIKEEYIGYFFNLDSEFFLKLERLKRTLDQKVADRKFEDIRFIVNNIHIKQEKQELLKSFDTVFLRIFPQFVSRFNALFKPEDQVRLKENELLNIDMRIFALIRVGITDVEKIAQILEYSVNTIYAYKTRIKSKSIIPNDEFEARIMEIKSV